MAFYLLASFPNSRVKPRPSTQAAVQQQYDGQGEDETSAAAMLLLPLNLNRTYLLIKNLTTDRQLYYVNASAAAANPTITPTLGVLDQIVTFGDAFYQKFGVNGTDTAWQLVNIFEVGERIGPDQTADLESLEAFYCQFENNGVATKGIGIDEGRG